MNVHAVPAGIRQRAREYRVDFTRFTRPVLALIRLSPVKFGVAYCVSRNDTERALKGLIPKRFMDDRRASYERARSLDYC